MSTTEQQETPTFDYDAAFSRNIGWVTTDQQATLRRASVALAGQGGVGSEHAQTLARLGIGNFKISDFDEFSIHNMNRQAGCFMSTLGQPKMEVMARVIKDINPSINLQLFPGGIFKKDIDKFLEGVDVYVDCLDFFALAARRMVFAECHKRGIPVLTAAPVGMGTGFLYFSPTGMTAEDYFGWKDFPLPYPEGPENDGYKEADKLEMFVRFATGLTPGMLMRNYIADDSTFDFHKRKGPSTAMACKLCAGVMGTAVLKLLLKRGEVKAAPWGLHFDAFEARLKTTYRPMGYANPLQKITARFVREKTLAKKQP
jgi:hypothetical protein